ncbi:hypothetical protein DFS33DRAFT_1272544 [Desarmillaria ectypa]|nr:hypothetical protein DFS33DRAFT_1272544 [Desarmillaria ectypa]
MPGENEVYCGIADASARTSRCVTPNVRVRRQKLEEVGVRDGSMLVVMVFEEDMMPFSTFGLWQRVGVLTYISVSAAAYGVSADISFYVVSVANARSRLAPTLSTVNSENWSVQTST